MSAVNGTIKRLVHDKGFGFVADEGGREYFFHQSPVRPSATFAKARRSRS